MAYQSNFNDFAKAVQFALQLLKLVGAGGHYPTNKLQEDEEGNPAAKDTLFRSSLESLKGQAEAISELALFAVYKVRAAAHHSLLLLKNAWRNNLSAAQRREINGMKGIFNDHTR